MKQQSKRQLRKKATLLKHKEIRKVKRDKVKAEKLAYANWVKAVKERDNYTCQLCGKKFSSPKAIQAMHILSKENYPELKFDIMNGLTGCYYDHKNSKLSPHLDGFAFSYWLNINKPTQYYYLRRFLELHSPFNLKREVESK